MVEVLMQRMILAVMLLATVVQSACGALAEPRQPEDLIAYIRAAETAEVRESWGEAAGECFTWNDYDSFVRAKRPAVVAGQLKVAPQFRTLVEMIRAMPQTEREKLLARARETARPTWAMIGRISPDGTTEAGRKADLLLAESITGAVEELLAAR
jgi:hypothetical protein